ncbi:MAG: pyridoxal-phosphate dependent enzyme, partial [Clostridia bacterium]
ANLYPSAPPKMIIMEAQAADCLYRGALAGDGSPRIVEGDLATIMAGLACGEPNTLSWDILRNHADAFVSCPDWVSAKGMRMLAAPVKGDPAVTSGESGAVGMGLIAALMENEEYRELREAIGLDRHSKALFFSTEGATDPDQYRQVVWGGKYPTA